MWYDLMPLKHHSYLVFWTITMDQIWYQIPASWHFNHAIYSICMWTDSRFILKASRVETTSQFWVTIMIKMFFNCLQRNLLLSWTCTTDLCFLRTMCKVFFTILWISEITSYMLRVTGDNLWCTICIFFKWPFFNVPLLYMMQGKSSTYFLTIYQFYCHCCCVLSSNCLLCI